MAADRAALRHFTFPKMPKSSEKLDLPDGDWVVTEKVHGANFQLISDGSHVRFGRRRALISEDEDFMRFRTQGLAASLAPKAKAVARAVRDLLEDGDEVGQVIVYGELFGGGYSHPEVSAVPGLMPVQLEVAYHPELRFAAFDVAFMRDDRSRAEWLPYDSAIGVLEACDIMHMPILFRGSYEEAINYEIGWDTRVPELLGLPPLPSGSNTAEGVVVKSLGVRRVKSGSIAPAAIKVKVAAFSEGRPALSDKAAREQAKRKARRKGASADAVSAMQQLLWEAVPMVTPARVSSVISKRDAVDGHDPEELPRVAAEVVEDVMDDLQLEHEELWATAAALGADVTERVRAAVSDEATAVVAAKLSEWAAKADEVAAALATVEAAMAAAGERKEEEGKEE